MSETLPQASPLAAAVPAQPGPSAAAALRTPVAAYAPPAAVNGAAAPPAAAAASATVIGAPAAAIRTEVTVPLRFADGYTTTARVFTFDGLADGGEHLAIGLGEWQDALDRSRAGGPAPLVRPHSECLTGDVLGSQRCDCGPQLREAVEYITEAGGLLLYLRQEGRGIGLYAKLDAYALQDAGLDTYEANVALGRGEDERNYTAAAQMLLALGVDRVALLSNNPDKATQLERLGVRVAERIPTGVHLSEANGRYLATKARRAAHTLDLPPAG
jgi:GTP cyclohydrolase II